MNNETHMKEPWVLRGLHIDLGDMDAGTNCYIVGKGHGAAEHMRRIVACVNACAGLGTELLENAVRDD